MDDLAHRLYETAQGHKFDVALFAALDFVFMGADELNDPRMWELVANILHAKADMASVRALVG